MKKILLVKKKNQNGAWLLCVVHFITENHTHSLYCL